MAAWSLLKSLLGWAVHPSLLPRGRCDHSRNIKLILNTAAHDGVIPIGQYIIDTREPLPARVAYRNLLDQTEDPSSPECVKFKADHKKDEQFTKWVKAIDRIVTDQLARKAA